MMPLTSVIIPVYNEAENIRPLYEELCRYLPEKREIIWVDDGSTDSTPQLLENIAHTDSNVKLISLSKNFGHQNALMAGLKYASGEYIITMDGDFQHPPSLIPHLLQALNDGADIAQTKRLGTSGVSLWKKVSSRLFYRFINAISDTPVIENESDFRAFNKQVLSEINQMSESEIFLRGIFNWIGFQKTIVTFHAPARRHGKSKYSFRKMLKLALRGTVAFSFKPLRISLLFGMLASSFSFILLIYSITAYFKGLTVPGWASLMTVVTFMGGIQLLVMGIMGEYVAAIFRETKKRPSFIIKRKINL